MKGDKMNLGFVAYLPFVYTLMSAIVIAALLLKKPLMVFVFSLLHEILAAIFLIFGGEYHQIGIFDVKYVYISLFFIGCVLIVSILELLDKKTKQEKK